MSELVTTTPESYNSGNRVANYQTQNQAVILAAAVLDKRIATAKQWPRSVSRFKQEATELLQSDIETAMSAEYAKPVGNGFVRGPSVRLAELASLCWGNLEVEISDPIVSETSVTVQSMAWDLERNIRMPGIATTSIMTKNNVRYPQHLIETTISAAASKARRNAILAVIPRAYINDLLEAAKLVASKNQKPLEQVRVEMLNYFATAFKVDSIQIFEHLKVAGVDDIRTDHIDELRAVATAIKEGEPAEAYFGKAKSKVEIAKEKIEARKKPETKTEQPQTEEPAQDTIGQKLFAELMESLKACKTEKELEKLQARAEANWSEFEKDQAESLLATISETAQRVG